MRVEQEIPVDAIEYDRLPMKQYQTWYMAYLLFSDHKFQPIKVANLGDGRFRVLDGRHRLAAHIIEGRRTILARFSFTPLRTP